jgi:hypothetical protein
VSSCNKDDRQPVVWQIRSVQVQHSSLVCSTARVWLIVRIWPGRLGVCSMWSCSMTILVHLYQFLAGFSASGSNATPAAVVRWSSVIRVACKSLDQRHALINRYSANRLTGVQHIVRKSGTLRQEVYRHHQPSQRRSNKACIQCASIATG